MIHPLWFRTSRIHVLPGFSITLWKWTLNQVYCMLSNNWVYLSVICMFEFTFTFELREENPFNFFCVIIQNVYCSWLTGFLLMASQSEKEMTDGNMSAVALSGGRTSNSCPLKFSQSLSLSVCLFLWQHGNFDISVVLEFSKGLWGLLFSYFQHTTVEPMTVNY